MGVPAVVLSLVGWKCYVYFSCLFGVVHVSLSYFRLVCDMTSFIARACESLVTASPPFSKYTSREAGTKTYLVPCVFHPYACTPGQKPTSKMCCWVTKIIDDKTDFPATELLIVITLPCFITNVVRIY